MLADRLRDEASPVVLGIARGGVLVAAPVAHALRAPLDVCVVRKVGHPSQPELAMGAVSAAGDVVLTEHARDVASDKLDELIAGARARADALEFELRGGRAPIHLAGRTAILVDDGIATSATMLCALETARNRGAVRVVCAVPVAPGDFLERLRAKCDRLVVLVPAREWHFAVGRYYADFREVSDQEVRAALAAEPEPS
ncbi:MAG TPA: phosphoribosyltransferase family protein [Candidatus Eremiobacteraceae bacterium]|nr:phosphoribosyltransferase family protein [Candidatus Eremiobacteraceae bacterium]